MLIFTRSFKAFAYALFAVFNIVGFADFAAELLLNLFMSNISITKKGKQRANVYVLLTSKPVDGNRYVDDFITEYNLLPGKKIIRTGESLVIGEVYKLHEQLRVYLIRAIVEDLNG